MNFVGFSSIMLPTGNVVPFAGVVPWLQFSSLLLYKHPYWILGKHRKVAELSWRQVRQIIIRRWENQRDLTGICKRNNLFPPLGCLTSWSFGWRGSGRDHGEHPSFKSGETLVSRHGGNTRTCTTLQYTYREQI